MGVSGGAKKGVSGGAREIDLPRTTDSEDRLRAALLDWYAANKRVLPWRDERDPYAIWVSEIMLQQTRVAAVIPYYERWMALFPDVATLAEAPLEAVLGAWQGLGYYSRARNLHRAARAIAADGGALPADRAAWRALPGVGAYTAGAIASIALGEPVAAVDGNVKRVLARLYAVDADPARVAFRRAIETHADRLAAGVPAVGGAPGDWTQALMELGATVCVARGPRCEQCPVAAWCAALAVGRVDELPRPAARSRVRESRVLALRIARPGLGEGPDGSEHLLVARRPPEGLLGGLWELPLVPWDPGYETGRDEPAAIAHTLLDGLRDGSGAKLAIHEALLLPPVEHVFSHLRLSVEPLAITLAAGRGGCSSRGDRSSSGDHSAADIRPVARYGQLDRDPIVAVLREGGPDAASARRAGLPVAYETWRWVTREELAELATSVLMDKLVRAFEHAARPQDR